jgi:hypothetical protein
MQMKYRRQEQKQQSQRFDCLIQGNIKLKHSKGKRTIFENKERRQSVKIDTPQT